MKQVPYSESTNITGHGAKFSRYGHLGSGNCSALKRVPTWWTPKGI